MLWEGDRGGLGDEVPGEEGHVHPRLTLGHAVAHGGYAAGNLGTVAELRQGALMMSG